MCMPREISNTINYILDNIIPPIFRDQYWFMAPFMRIVLGSKFKYYTEFKEKVPYLTNAEIDNYYTLLADTFIKRETDLNKLSVSFILGNLKGDSVIDIGCGRGYLTRQILKLGRFKEIYGFDVSPPSVCDGIVYQSGSILNLPYVDKQFDTVICAHTLEHIFDIDTAIKELKRITRKRLIIVMPRQREYKYTFDLHIHFLPYLYSFKKLINEPDAIFHELNRDFICVVDY